MKRASFILFLFLFCLSEGIGQYSLVPSLSNYHLTWTTFNPGFTGYRELASGSLFYRNKMYGDTGPVDFQLNAHTPVFNGTEAVGVIFSNNRITNDNKDLLTRITSGMFTYAHRFRVKGGHLSLGLSAGMYQIKEDYKSLSLRNPLDPSFISPEMAPTRWFPNFGVGGVYYDKRMFIGLSVPELFSVPLSTKRFDIGDADLSKYRIILIGAYLFDFSRNFNMKPALFVDYNRSNTTFKASANFGLLDNRLFVGGVYHHPNYAVVLLNIPVQHEKYMLGFAYTIPLSDIALYYSGTWEIVLRIEWRSINRIPEPNPFYF
ncbi:MAG: PorP/SprF family type IX secretion system membrane protein [Bacteroidales bacterium]|nr:PorP/SprF family type IX secretion system membrane protein [Bacteroidales bacterium]MBN2699136.1 PorP/SprF family type IX secretion system membrane protein [Bacteroidales bacterium]